MTLLEMFKFNYTVCLLLRVEMRSSSLNVVLKVDYITTNYDLNNKNLYDSVTKKERYRDVKSRLHGR